MYLKKVNIANPLKYFIDLETTLLNKYHQEFKNDPGYLPEKNKRWVYYGEGYSGRVIDYEESFEEYIDNYLKYNSNKIMEYLYERFDTDSSIIESHAYISEVRKELDTILKKFKTSSKPGHLKVYEVLIQIKTEIEQKIFTYIEIGVNSGSSSISKDKLKELQGQRGIKSYHWIGDHFLPQIIVLYDLLKRNNIIDKNTDLENFRKAFNGEPIDVPLKLKWTVLSRNQEYSSKSSLFYFLSRLSDKGLIDYTYEEDNDNSEYRRISLIFCDFKGKPFKNLKQSKQSWLKSIEPIQSDLIDSIIDHILTRSNKVNC